MAEKKTQLISTLESRKTYVEDCYQRFLEEARTDNKFYRGEQWDEATKDKLKAEGRPKVTYNHIKGKINTLKGQQAENRYYFKVIAADNVQSDEMVKYDGKEIPMDEAAKLLTEEIKKIEEENDGEYELTDTFGDGSVSARSYIEPFIKTDKSVFPYEYQVVFENRCYNEVFPDPDSRKYDMSDGRYFFKFKDISKEDLIELFPGKDKEIMVMKRDTDDFYEELKKNKDNELRYTETNNTNASKEKDGATKDEDLILVEYYYYKWEKSHVVITNAVDEMGQPTSERTDIEESKFKDAEKILKMRQKADPGFQYKAFDLKKKVWYLISYCDKKVLDDDEDGQKIDEIDEIPFVQYAPDCVKSLQDMYLRYIGAVRELRSPQEFVNKSKGQAMAHLNSSVHSGIAHVEGALVDEKSWEKYGSAPGFRGEIKEGYWDKWKVLNPEQLSQGHMIMAADSEEEMKNISNIKDEFSGNAQAKNASGKAINSLQRAQFKGIHFYFDNFRRTKHLLCKKLVKLVCYLKGCDHKKLKVVIDDTIESPTVRSANLVEVKEMLEGGAFDSAFGDLIIDSTNINNREEWKQRYTQVNEFKRWQLEQQQKEEAEKMAMKDAQAEIKARGGAVQQP